MRRPFRRGGLVLLAVLVLTLPAPPAARAGSFSLLTFLPRAKVIVQGRLAADGTLSVPRVLHGQLPDEGPLFLADGAACYRRLRGLLDQELADPDRPGGETDDGCVEVVAFLEEQDTGQWVPVGARAGVVGLGPRGVYATFAEMRSWQTGVIKYNVIAHPHYRRESFLRRLEAEIGREDDRRRLAAEPPSGARAARLVSLFLDGVPYEADSPQDRTAAILRPAHTEEEAAVAAALRDADDEDDVVAMLGLTAAVPLPGLFDAVADRTGREQPAAVRKAAFRALARLDHYRAAGRLARLLSLDDPLCVDLLDAVTPEHVAGKPARLNREAGDAVFMLALDLRRRLRGQADDALVPLSEAVQARACEYLHPGMVPFFADWAFDGMPFTSLWALGELNRRTGRSFDRENRAEWDSWWKEAGPLLGPSYDLGTARGRRAWRQAYLLADPAARELLLRWWLYEPDPDETELLGEATGDDFPAAAQAVLAELWARQRLSTATREAILRRFVTLRLEEETAGGRRWRVEAECAFPLPVEANLGSRCGFEEEGEWELLNFGDGGARTLAKMTPPPGAGHPAWVTVELRETERQNGDEVLWSAAWSVGP
jgi:hypothetical protein